MRGNHQRVCAAIFVPKGQQPVFYFLIECPELPKVQAYIAKVCKEHNKNFMVVTQMLDSMIRNPYPTRAEVNDIYHAVHQGANALMLTGETAHGRYPVEAMKMLVETANGSLEEL